MEFSLVQYKILPKKREMWLNWCDELKEAKAEIIDGLKERGVLIEACFSDVSGENIFIFIASDDLEKTTSISNSSNQKIIQKRRSIHKYTLEFVGVLSQMYNLSVD
ncbi:MAG: DUF6176 family protein [Candidatus Heimdallarchaeota archaeon]|nr:DUF6176 family protein [Candidatus Heimdallarchaeota archaeon]MDH5646286.1 DUF6176 family protein [Candidatus Heimdallarchaeota archaeon]